MTRRVLRAPCQDSATVRTFVGRTKDELLPGLKHRHPEGTLHQDSVPPYMSPEGIGAKAGRVQGGGCARHGDVIQ